MIASTWFRRLGRSASRPEFSTAQRSNACRSGFRSESLDFASACAASGVRHAVPGLRPVLLWLPLLLGLAAPAAAQTIDSSSITEGETKTFTVSGIPSSWTGTPTLSASSVGNSIVVGTCPAMIDTIVSNWDVCNPGNVTWDAGTRVFTFEIRAHADSVSESGEAFSARVRDGDDSSRTASFTITIDEVSQPTVTITGGAAVTEGGEARFTINVNPAPTANLTVGFTISEETGDGQEFLHSTVSGGSFSTIISANQTSATYNVTTLNDSTDEPNGSVTVTLAGRTGYNIGTPSSASVTVNDDDALTLSVASEFDSRLEGSMGIITDKDNFFVTLSGLTVVGNVDFRVCFSGTATLDTDTNNDFPSGEDYQVLVGSTNQHSNCVDDTVFSRHTTNRREIGVRINGDTAVEPDETVIATLTLRGTSNPPDVSLGTATATFTIVDDDAVVSRSDYAFLKSYDTTLERSEGAAGRSHFLVTRVRVPGENDDLATFEQIPDPWGFRLCFEGTATLGEDYTVFTRSNRPLSLNSNGCSALNSRSDGTGLAAGQDRAHFYIQVIDDAHEDSGEEIVVILDASTGTSLYDFDSSFPGNPDGVSEAVREECARGGACPTDRLIFTILNHDGPPAAAGPYAELVAKMYGWRNDPQWESHKSHTDRWDRALLAFGETVEDASLTPMAAIDAQGYADRGWTRWVEVAKALHEIEAAQAAVTQAPTMQVSNVQVAAVNATSATVTWDAVEHATSYRVEYEGAASNPQNSVSGAVDGHTDTTWTFEHNADEAMTLTVTVTPAYEDENGDTQQLAALAGTATIDVAPARSIGDCVSVAKWKTVSGYYESNAERGPNYGANWYRVLIAYGQERSDKTMPEWEGATTKPTTSYTAEEAAKGEAKWSGWTPVRKTLECLEKESTPSQQSSQQEQVSAPEISLTAGAAVSEGGNAVFTVEANPAPQSDLPVTINIDDDPTSDFLATGDEGSQTVVIQANQTSATLTLATENDSTDEPNGSVSATVASGTGYTVGSPSTATVTVNDNDDPPITIPVVSITSGNGITEGGGASFILTATPAPQSDITVQVAVADSGSFATTSQTGIRTVTIGATGTATLTVATADDDTDEANGSIAATIQPGNGYTVATSPDNGASVTVSDNDDPPITTPVVSITGGNGITEGGAASFTLTATPAPQSDITVQVAVADSGSFATTGQTGTRTVTIGATGAATLTVATADDDTDEANGSITATIQAGNGYTVATSPGNEASVTVADNDAAPGLPSFSVEDAEANESDFRLHYTIRLSRASDRRVSVWVHTRESNPVSARDGVDYVGMGWGTRVAFPPGETERQLGISLINDSHDEGAETFQVELLAPQGGATIADGVGVMTIVNSDPLPAAWHLRFGRTVSHQVVDALQDRLSSPAPLETGLQLTFAGEDFTSNTPLAENQGLLSKALGFESLTGEELVEGSSFSFAPQGEEGAPQFALWGQGALSSFSGQEEDVSLDGDVTTLLVGADWSATRWQAGAALSHSWGSGSYDGEDNADGEISTTLTGVFPYGRYALSPRLGIWATAGYGWGALSLSPDGNEEEYKPDTTMTMVALGMDGLLLDGGNEGVSLNATADFLSLKTTSEEIEGLESSEGNLSRFRLGLEATRPFPLANGSSLLPSMEVGIRQDGGDAENGFGLDLGAGISWKDPQRGISGELKGRTLLFHAEEEFQDQGLALSFSWDPSPSNRGPSLSMGHAMGLSTEEGIHALLNPTVLDGLDPSPSNGKRFEAELSYGFPLHNDRLTLTPVVAMALSPTSRNYGLLWSLAPYTEQLETDPWQFSIEAERQEQNTATSPVEHSLKLRFSSLF